jgi:hypothetical protein
VESFREGKKSDQMLLEETEVPGSVLREKWWVGSSTRPSLKERGK